MREYLFIRDFSKLKYISESFKHSLKNTNDNYNDTKNVFLSETKTLVNEIAVENKCFNIKSVVIYNFHIQLIRNVLKSTFLPTFFCKTRYFFWK